MESILQKLHSLSVLQVILTDIGSTGLLRTNIRKHFKRAHNLHLLRYCIFQKFLIKFGIFKNSNQRLYSQRMFIFRCDNIAIHGTSINSAILKIWCCSLLYSDVRCNTTSSGSLLNGFYKKMARVGWEPRTTEFHSHILTEWTIRPQDQLALAASYLQLHQIQPF